MISISDIITILEKIWAFWGKKGIVLHFMEPNYYEPRVRWNFDLAPTDLCIVLSIWAWNSDSKTNVLQEIDREDSVLKGLEKVGWISRLTAVRSDIMPFSIPAPLKLPRSIPSEDRLPVYLVFSIQIGGPSSKFIEQLKKLKRLTLRARIVYTVVEGNKTKHKKVEGSIDLYNCLRSDYENYLRPSSFAQKERLLDELKEL